MAKKVGMAIMTPVFLQFPVWELVIPLLYLILHIKTWGRLKQSSGAAINPLLGRTAINLLIFALFFASIIYLTIRESEFSSFDSATHKQLIINA